MSLSPCVDTPAAGQVDQQRALDLSIKALVVHTPACVVFFVHIGTFISAWN